MRLVRSCSVLFMICVVASVANAQDPHDVAMGKKMAQFLEANFSNNATADIRQKSVATCQAFAAQGDDIQALLGSDIIARRKSLYLLTFGGEMQVFELTPAQARGLGMRPDIATIDGYKQFEAERRIDKPVVTLSNLTFKNADAAPGDREIIGSFVCKPTGQPANGAFTLSVTVKRPSGFTRSFIPLKDSEVYGTVPIRISPLNRGKEELDFGPTPVLVDILMSPPDGNTVFAGSTVATIVNVLPDIESFTKNGLAVMNRFADLLASVKDRESATRMKDEYVRFALQNKELGDAMQRIAPQSKEQNDAFERQHGAELDAVAKRMQAEYDRLQQADYAGTAFFDELDKAVKAAQ